MTTQDTKDQRSGRISDIDLRELIRSYENNGELALFPQQVLLALYELSNRRAADDIRLGLKEPQS